MADLLWWLGHADETTAKVVVRSDTNGVITMTGVTNDGTKTAATTTADGIVVFTASGLTANTSYPFTITHSDATSEAGTLRSMPSSGDTYKFGWGSCNDNAAKAMGGLQAVSTGVIGFAHIGDLIYANGAGDAFGESPEDGDIDQTTANFNALHRQSMKDPGMKFLSQSAPFYYMADDHEWSGDNWDHSGTQANATDSTFTLQSEVDAAWATETASLVYYQSGNPANADTGTAIAEKPSDHERAADADFAVISAAASAYPVTYCRWTIGDAEFFMLDCISYRSAIASTNNSSKTMLGANQKAWLKAQLDASTATFKIILSPKKTHANAGADNGDLWSQYSTEMTELLDYIKSDVSGNLTGIVWLSGDRHTPSVEAQAIADGETYDHVCVCACPLSVSVNTAQGTIGTTTKLLKPHWNNVFGVVEVVGSSHLLLQMRNASNGNIRWEGKVLAGSNALIYDDIQVAI